VVLFIACDSIQNALVQFALLVLSPPLLSQWDSRISLRVAYNRWEDVWVSEGKEIIMLGTFRDNILNKYPIHTHTGKEREGNGKFHTAEITTPSLSRDTHIYR